MPRSKKERVYQLWQIWNDDGSKFLMGTYKTLKRANEERNWIENTKLDIELKYPVQYIISCEKVIS